MKDRQIDIEWLTDEHECDTCGWSTAEGAKITIDGKPAICLEPSAYCFGSDQWDADQVLGIVLGEMGIRTLLTEPGCDPEDISRGRPSDKLAPLDQHAPVARIEMSAIWDETRDDFSQGYRTFLGNEVIFDHPPALRGSDKSPYHSSTEALVALAEHCGARFTPGSIEAWMRGQKEA